MQRHSIFIGLVLVVCGGCPAEADEDLQEAHQGLEQAGQELGQAARKTVTEVDAAAARAGVRVSAGIEQAREDLEATRRAIDMVADSVAREAPTQADTSRGPGASIRCASERYEVERELYDDALANPLALAGQIRVEPVEGTGTTAGYRLAEIEAGSIAAQLGFVPGDVIVAVDGHHLNQAPSSEMLAELQAADEVTVTVERDGERFEKTIEIGTKSAVARGG